MVTEFVFDEDFQIEDCLQGDGDYIIEEFLNPDGETWDTVMEVVNDKA